MGAVWMRARAELRRTWRATLVIGLLVGITAGAAIAAAAGARRTESAYPRFLDAYGHYHAQVAAREEDLDEVARLPQVRWVVPTRLFLGRITVKGKTLSFPDVFLIAGLIPPGAPNPRKLVSGRLADEDAVDEVVVNYALAERLEIEPGDVVTGSIFGSGFEGPSREEPIRLRVAGVVAQPGGFETLTGTGFPTVVGLTRAFGERFGDLAVRSGGAVAGVSLRRGEADLDAFTRDLRAAGIETDGPPTALSVFTEDVQELNRVPVVTLWALAGLLAIAGIAIFAQAIAREAVMSAGDHPALRALGMSRRWLFALGMVRAAVIAAVGALTSVALAFLFSPLYPVGIARVAEPDPGFSADVVALAAGAAVTLLVVLAAGALPAWRAALAARSPGPRGEAGRRSRVAEGLARAAAPPSAVAGVRMALEPGHGAAAVPVRTATLGAAIAIGAVVAAMVFVSSLDRLLEQPRLTGYSWDAAVVPMDSPDQMEALQRALPRDIVVRTWKGVVFPLIDVGGLSVTAFASEGPPPSIIEGRPPRAPDEVALDPITLERLGKGIGDVVTVRDAPETGGDSPETTAPTVLRIVGSFVVARLPFQPNENAAQGAALTPEGLQRIDPFEFEAIHVEFGPEVDVLEGIDRIKEATGGRAFVFSPLQLGAVRNIQRISQLPLLVAGLLVAVAVATLAHTLVSTARRRRRDLAVLKTVGFIGRQVRATVAWQSTTIALLSLVAGVPLGAAVGRWAWRLFAEEIIVVPEPVVSGAVLVGIVPVTLLLANLIAELPARAAARTRPAVVLRTE